MSLTTRAKTAGTIRVRRPLAGRTHHNGDVTLASTSIGRGEVVDDFSDIGIIDLRAVNLDHLGDL
ncbi:MAG: hypothetical protein KGK01_19390, partial [Bradyrhizobium sp.]|nr:hypothetical protein [Bradyrhizobium sp.]